MPLCLQAPYSYKLCNAARSVLALLASSCASPYQLHCNLIQCCMRCREAQEFAEKHHSRGKVVIDIWHEPIADQPPS